MSDFLRKLLPLNLNLEDGPVGDPRPDLPLWAQGTPFDAREGLDDVKARAAINPIHFLNWRTLPDGTRTYRLDGVGKQAWLDFFSALPWQGPEDAVRRGHWSRVNLLPPNRWWHGPSAIVC